MALVIGNGAYAHAPRLPNPKNDAEDVTAALRRVGFDVIAGLDLDKPAMDNAAIRFARAARDADVAIFYYSGHAMQHNGVNYLMPVDAKLADEADLRLMMRTDSIVADLQQAKNLRILVLDSCRDNPIAEELKRSIGRTRAAGLSRGLAKIDTPEGMIVAYATQAGRTAEDGRGRNSPYTTAFLKYIEQQDEIGTVFRRISADVFEATRRTQLPELSLSLIGEYYLKGRAAVAAPAPESSEVAALREQLRLMQEQINRRDQAMLPPPVAPPPQVAAPAPARPAIAAPPVAARPDPFHFPPPPEPAPVELGERAAAARVEAPSRESGLVELGAQAAKQAVRDPFNLPAPPEPAPVELGAHVNKQAAAIAPPAPARQQPQAARDPYNLPPPPEPAPVELGAQAALAPRPSQPFSSPAPSTAPMRHVRDIKGPLGKPRSWGETKVLAQWDGRAVVALGTDGEYRRWDIDTGTSLESARLNWGDGGFDRLALSPTGNRVAINKFTDTHVFESTAVVTGGLRTLWKDTDPNRAGCTGNAIAFSPDGKILAKAYPVSSIRLYDASSGRVIRTLPGLDRPKVCQISSAAFTPDGRYLVTSTYRVFEVASGKLVRTLADGEAANVNDDAEIAISADGKTAAILSDTQLGMWDIGSGRRMWTTKIPDYRIGNQSVAYAPDGRYVAVTRGSKPTIRIYDGRSGQEVQALNTPALPTSLAISKDSRRMVSTHADGTISIWQMADEAMSRR